MKVPGSPADYYYYHYDGSCNVTCITDADKEIMALYGTPRQAWLNKWVQFPSGKGIANRPELSLALRQVTG